MLPCTAYRLYPPLKINITTTTTTTTYQQLMIDLSINHTVYFAFYVSLRYYKIVCLIFTDFGGWLILLLLLLLLLLL